MALIAIGQQNIKNRYVKIKYISIDKFIHSSIHEILHTYLYIYTQPRTAQALIGANLFAGLSWVKKCVI